MALATATRTSGPPSSWWGMPDRCSGRLVHGVFRVFERIELRGETTTDGLPLGCCCCVIARNGSGSGRFPITALAGLSGSADQQASDEAISYTRLGSLLVGDCFALLSMPGIEPWLVSLRCRRQVIGRPLAMTASVPAKQSPSSQLLIQISPLAIHPLDQINLLLS